MCQKIKFQDWKILERSTISPTTSNKGLNFSEFFHANRGSIPRKRFPSQPPSPRPTSQYHPHPLLPWKKEENIRLRIVSIYKLSPQFYGHRTETSINSTNPEQTLDQYLAGGASNRQGGSDMSLGQADNRERIYKGGTKNVHRQICRRWSSTANP